MIDIREHYIVCDTNMRAHILYSETLDYFKETGGVDKVFKTRWSLQIHLKSGHAFYFVTHSYDDLFLTGRRVAYTKTSGAEWEQELKDIRARERLNKYLGGV